MARNYGFGLADARWLTQDGWRTNIGRGGAEARRVLADAKWLTQNGWRTNIGRGGAEARRVLADAKWLA